MMTAESMEQPNPQGDFYPMTSMPASGDEVKKAETVDIETRKFGMVTVFSDRILTMPDGLPGFPGKKQFALLELEEIRPFFWFQSIDDPDIALIVMDPFQVLPDYEVDVEPMVKAMGWAVSAKEEIAVYTVATIGVDENGNKRITANLIGPIVIHTGLKQATQMVIADSPYSHQQVIA